MIISLTDAAIRGLSPPASGRIEIQDSRCRGLAIRVTAGGVKSWTFRYRDRASGKAERKTLGRYPDVSLARAREIADSNRVEVYAGQSPQEQIRLARRLEKKAPSFDDLADRYLREAVEPRKAASTAGVERAYLASARAAFKGRKAKEISRQDIRDFSCGARQNGPGRRQPHARHLIDAVRLGRRGGVLDATPVVKIARPTKYETPKDRVLNVLEIVALWLAFDGLDKPMSGALRLLLVTGQRPGQIVTMEQGELHDLHDPQKAAWHIPPSKRKDPRGKKRGPHIVPLTRLAVEIVEGALRSRFQDDQSPFVFWSRRNHGAAIERNSLSQALRRLVASLPAIQGCPPTPHDLSSTLRNLCRVAKRFRESFHEGGWNFYTVRWMPRH
jgi:integrase